MSLSFVSFFLPLNIYASETNSCYQIWEEILEEEEFDEMYRPLVYSCGNDFRQGLREIISTNQYINYKKTRLKMFGHLDNNDGEVCGVYTGQCITTSGIPNHRIMNCEHTWPQSMGATGIAKSDLHHLFPVMMRVNSRRSNHPFCEVENVRWQGGGSYYGTSREGVICFEPRDDHKGDVARAMFYFSIRYSLSIDKDQEYYFRKWIKTDPISLKEENRNNQIEDFQNNRNPFIDYPLFSQIISDF